MSKKLNIVPLKELNLTDRFLFDEVMEDSQTHQDALSIIFGREIPLLDCNETEKEIRISPLLRSIRMDVFSMDEDRVIYNTEMHKQRKSDLAKRSRYYQSMIDSGILEPGIPSYNLLNTSYIITITPFDLFGYGRYRYTFHARCEEELECLLEDGATRIFLNTRGKNDQEVSRELVEFLHYLEDTTDRAAEQADSERIKCIHDRVRKVKSSEEVGVKYMQAWEERYYEREEGRKEGKAQGERNKLREQVLKKLDKGKNADEIADALEESVDTIRELIDELKKDQ